MFVEAYTHTLSIALCVANSVGGLRSHPQPRSEAAAEGWKAGSAVGWWGIDEWVFAGGVSECPRTHGEICILLDSTVD